MGAGLGMKSLAPAAAAERRRDGARRSALMGWISAPGPSDHMQTSGMRVATPSAPRPRSIPHQHSAAVNLPSPGVARAPRLALCL